MLETANPALYKGGEKARDTLGEKKDPLTLDEMKQRDLTYLEQVYGEQAKKDAAAHEAAVKAQERARKDANRSEYIGNELMMKYLPQLQAMKGTAGMGTSSTDAVAVYNAYLGRVSGNNAAYEQNVTDLNTQKAEVDFERESQKREALYDVHNRYEDERQEQAQEESEGLLSLMADKAAGYYGSDEKLAQEDYDKLLAFYRANENRLTETGQRNALDALAVYREAIREEKEQQVMDKLGFIEGTGKVTTEPVSYKPGKNFRITGGDGRKYLAEVGEEVTDQTIKLEAAKVDTGEVFGYGGKLFVKHGDRVYAVEARNSGKKSYKSLYELYFGDGNEGEQQGAVTVDIPTANKKNKKTEAKGGKVPYEDYLRKVYGYGK